MAFRRKSPPPPRRGGGPPTWFIVIIALAIVFGSYYTWLGIQNFLRTGGLGVIEATERVEIVNTATAERIIQRTQVRAEIATQRPTSTPIPECIDFVVDVPNAIVREQPSANAAIADSLFQGDIVCVVGRDANEEWYIVDGNRRSRRLEPVYMHETVIRAVNPTPTPSDSPTPLPTITLTPSPEPSNTPPPQPTATRDPAITDTPRPTRSPTPTESFQSA
ncbi:MAG: hypothetical protein D6737_13475 [Chloroflexi bacterium]|nr:MAG: hypothetical protein CUN54_04100 [Phototrophicales bacterium]RMF78862.1 MAG: hypothetical protein D6737_13475 [Chloroflexota bacterium]